MKTVTIGNNKIGKNFPCYVIAEIGHNHQGKLQLALEMIEVAAACGVQAVKFQKREIDLLYTESYLNQGYNCENSFGKTYRAHRYCLEFNWDQFIKCKEKADACGLDFLITPFDPDSAEFCNELGVKAFKLASGDLTNEPLMRFVAAMKKPMLVSTGAAAPIEIDNAFRLLKSMQAEFVLLHAIAAYPANSEQLNLQRIIALQRKFPETNIGFSGHDQGIEGALYARVLGAQVIEKHFTLDQTLKGTDHHFSLIPEELKELVEKLKKVDQMLGTTYTDEFSINDYELDARKKMGKGIYAATNIKAGTMLSPGMLCFKSPGTELTPSDAQKIIGKIIYRDLRKDDPVQTDNLDDKKN